MWCPEGDDMATMETNYGLGRNSQSDTTQETLNKLFVHDMQFPNYPTFSSMGTIIRNADGSPPWTTQRILCLWQALTGTPASP